MGVARCAQEEGAESMKYGIFLVVFLANITAIFCILNPWFKGWETQGIVFLVLEAAFLLLIGVPVFVHHRRKGLTARDALAASLDSVMSFLSGWV